jgi:hypothetical protein
MVSGVAAGNMTVDGQIIRESLIITAALSRVLVTSVLTLGLAVSARRELHLPLQAY